MIRRLLLLLGRRPAVGLFFALDLQRFLNLEALAFRPRTSLQTWRGWLAPCWRR